MSFQWQEFSQKQLDSIFNSTSRINIWQGAVRSGKTIASIVRWLEYIKSGPDGNLLMTGKTHRTLKRNILDEIQKIVGESNYSYNRGLGEVTICGKKIYIAGANDARAEDKIRGMTLSGTYGDEISIWPEGFFNMLLSRLSVKGAKLFGTTNPEGPYHWLKQNYIDREDELDLSQFHFLLENNLTLDPSYIESLKKEYSGVWYQRYIEGLWVLAEGLIYDMFIANDHVVTKIPRIKQYWIGVDYGTANDTVFVLMGLGTDNNLYAIDEYRWGRKSKGYSKTDIQLRKELIEFIKRNNVSPQWIFIDPSAASFITELHQNRSKFPGRVAKANNNVKDGIEFVSSIIGMNGLYIHEKCKGLISEMQSYSWDSKAQERGEDKPLKENDHGPDAIRYVLYSLEKQIRRIIRKAA